jgi:transposase
LLQVPSSHGLRTNYISAAGNRGDFHFMTFKDSMNVSTLQEFFRRLMHDEPRPIYLILDNLRVHHATLVREWLAGEEVARHLKLFFLPPYSPELNPDELVHRTVKARVGDEVLPESIHAQQAQVLGILDGLKRSPGAVARLFCHPLVRYASRAM